MNVLALKIAVIIFSGVGFAIASKIAYHKAVKKPLVCPMRSRCDLVTESKHSRFFGIHNEQLGMFYYAVVAVAYGISIAMPLFLGAWTALVLFALPAVGFVFSLYLVLLQAFVIREWCLWCLGSAATATILLFLAVFAAPAGFF